jgi:tetratricopeptide (TPR) repeat protein
MVHFPKSRLAILAFWIKNTGALLLWLLMAPLGWGQKDSSAPSHQDLSFEKQFFKAQALKLRGDTAEAAQLFAQLGKEEPPEAVVFYELARLRQAQGQLPAALEAGEKAARLKPENPAYWKLLIGLYKQSRRPVALLEAYRQLLKLEPESPTERLAYSEKLLRQGKPQAALAQLDTLEDQLGTGEQITNLQKSIYLKLGMVDSAAAELRELIRAYPANLEYYGTLGQIYAANERPQKAYQVYQEMVARDSTDPRPHLDLANYYRQQGDLQASLQHLRIALRSEELPLDKKMPVLLSLFKASTQDTNLRRELGNLLSYLTAQPAYQKAPQLHTLYGDFLSQQGKDSAAVQRFLYALNLPGGSKFAIWEQVLLIDVQNGWYDSLATHSQAALARYPNQPLPYLFSGVAYTELDELKKAVEYLQTGLPYVLSNPRLKEQFYIQLADAYHRLEQHAQSDAQFEKALDINPRNATLLNNYAYYLAQRGEKLDKALKMTQRSNKLKPQNPTFLDTWAWVLYQQGKLAPARAKMEQVLRLDTSPSAEVLVHYADILKASGQMKKARKFYKKALKAGAPPEQVQAKMAELP